MNKDDSIKVMVRVRPVNEREAEENSKLCVSLDSNDPHNVILDCGSESKQFSFDWVGGLQTSQEDIFSLVGQPLVHTCLEGSLI